MDTEQTVKFYRDFLGFQLRVGDAFNNNKLMAETAGAAGAQFRQSSGQIPGSTVRITFIEFKDIDRKPLHTRLQDPGTALLQLRVRDVDALVKTLKAARHGDHFGRRRAGYQRKPSARDRARSQQSVFGVDFGPAGRPLEFQLAGDLHRSGVEELGDKQGSICAANTTFLSLRVISSCQGNR